MELRNYQTDTLCDMQNSFRTGHRRPLVVLPCGAGKTALFARMAESSQAKGKTIWFLVHRRELLNQTIETFDRFDIPRKTIHIGMVATVANHLYKYPKPDFIIFDEAHFSAAATWSKIIEAFPDAFIVGLTATPRRLDGKPLDKIYDDLIVGIGTAELIEQGYLASYKYYAPTVADLSALKKRGSDYDASRAAELLSQRAVFGDVIKHYQQYASGLQAICYCSTVAHSEAMADEFKAAGINAVHFDGNTPTKQRAQIVRDYRDKKIQILCNCDLISCGFDVPDCHCCILLRPTMSTALYIQQSMRAMRPQPGKTAIILDHVNNYKRHGLPDDEREWTLAGKLKPPKEYGEDGRLLIQQCPKCYHTYKAAPTCPECGYQSQPTAQEIKNIKEIQLEEVKRNRQAEAEKAVANISEPSECRNYVELAAFAKSKGFRPGWVYWQAKQRGWVS